jgi:Eukaryotic aspartyl protease
MHIDTASSSLCQESSDPCTASGTYDSSSSSTYKLINHNFNISYVDGSGASGDYVTDTLSIGGQSLSDFQFGIGSQSTSSEGVLGIGYTSNEIQVNRNQQQAYPNLPAAMMNAGLIQSNAYSLWLNDLDASTGQILFGGVNSAKYSGSLETVPIIQEYGAYYEFIIALTGLSMSGSSSMSSSSNLPAPVLLDSGSSLMYLPNDLTTDIFNQVNAVYDSNAGAAYVDCSLANSDSSISFSFSGATVSVPFSELVLNAGTNSVGQGLTFQNGVPACIFGVAPAEDSTPVLGDTFLRSAYVVYDLTNNEISLAQTNFNSTSDNIQAITNGTSSVPGATLVASAVTTVVAGTGGARLGGPTSAPTGSVSGAAVPVQVPMALAAVGLVGAMMSVL